MWKEGKRKVVCVVVRLVVLTFAVIVYCILWTCRGRLGEVEFRQALPSCLFRLQCFEIWGRRDDMLNLKDGVEEIVLRCRICQLIHHPGFVSKAILK